MKENKYDDDDFFEQYSGMPRSVEGLEAAGEWHALRKLLPDLKGKRVLDLGCGFGWHCRYAAERGAASVVGVDISRNMLERARRENAFPNVEYRLSAIEDVDFADASFDLAVSSLAFHYLESFSAVASRTARWLGAGGDFVFSVEHPVFTAQGPQDWWRDADGRPLHWPVDRYFEEGERQAVFLGQRVVKYHRTLSSYAHDLFAAGFAITALVEPRPEPGLLRSVPGMRDELRRPMMLILAAGKQ